MPPVVAGRFAIECETGAGGMATVYRARDLTTGDVVALKCLSSRAPEDAERFAREATILADLVHPAIVRHVAHGVALDWTGAARPDGRQASRPYLAMEWLDGEDLGARLALGALPAGEAISALRRVVDALALAHSRGVIHGDLKPGNLFLPGGRLDRIKLIDFGIARLADDARHGITTDDIIGTPGYLAPEVVGGKGRVSARSDIFAFGCVMFQALTGKAPFEADNVAAILTKVLSLDPPRVDALVPELPVALGDLVAATLARSPDHRPADAGQVARALETIALAWDVPAAGDRRSGSPSLTIGEQRITSAAGEARRRLLGRPGAFVGRARELGLLTSAFRDAVSSGVGSAVLVVAPAGSGKSRLRQEFLDWVAARPEPVEVLLAAGDSVGTRSPFALLGQALRRAAAIDDVDTADQRQRKLGLRVGRHLSATDAARVIVFLGELAGVPFPDAHDAALRAARQDPQLMGDHLRRAWQDWLAAECRAHPVLLLLDDLQWSDAGTVGLIDAALRSARGLPLMIMASARPEVEEAFPRLWADRPVQVVRLGPLSREAAEELVRDALGADVGEAIVARLLARADGNPFYLEELIRATHEGRHESLPDSVLGMVQARLDAEPADARRVLRAASVLGESFSIEGVSALLGGPEHAGEVTRWLRHLAERELVRPETVDGEAGAHGSQFTHALIREAAYSMLTPDDQLLGHRLAGRWLARTTFPDPMIVAEHLRRGAQPEQAVTWYEQAAVHALGANDLAAAIQRAGAGLEALAAIGAGDPRDNQQTRGRLRLVQAEAHLWRGEHTIAAQDAADAARALPPGSADWLRAASYAIVAVGRQGKLDEMDAWVAQVSGVLPGPGARSALTISLAWASIFLVFGGRYEAADELMAAVRDLAGEGEPGAEPQVMALLDQARAARASTRGDLGACLVWMEAALAEFERAGDERNACTARANVAFVYAELGDARRAEAVLRDALASAEPMGLADVRAIILHNLGRVVGMAGDLAEAERLEREALAQLEQQGEPRLEGLARTYLAAILTAAGRCEEAVEQAERAVATLDELPGLRALSLATLASARSAAGAPVQALAAARAAFSTLETLGTLEEGEGEIRLSYADCLARAGHDAEARVVIGEARDQLLVRAARIGDPVWRERFLRDVAANARTLALAAASGV